MDDAKFHVVELHTILWETMEQLAKQELAKYDIE
jgi:hypothetical protein